MGRLKVAQPNYRGRSLEGQNRVGAGVSTLGIGGTTHHQIPGVDFRVGHFVHEVGFAELCEGLLDPIEAEMGSL